MTDACKPNTNCCRLYPSHRHEVQYKDGDTWIIYGHKEAKKTCLWLKNLPLLVSTEIVEPEYVTFKSGKRMAKWYVEAAKLSPEKRAKMRSVTFQGIADAMANQWGGL